MTTLGIIVLIILSPFIFLTLAMVSFFVWFVSVFSITWIMGIPIKIKHNNKKVIGYIRWFKFYRY